MRKKITIVVDGVEIQGRTGETILGAADRAGLYIPRLCHYEGLEPHGSCRLCTVMVNGRPQAACTTPVAPGMIVENESERLSRLRSSLIEMLFVEGNHFCMFCEKSGNCELQALAYRFGIPAPHFPHLSPEREVDASHPDILIDHNRCILCARCIRASHQKEQKHALGFVGRGPGKRLALSARGDAGHPDLRVDDELVRVCPVGALLEKRVGYRVPIGRRKYDREPIGSEIECVREASSSAERDGAQVRMPTVTNLQRSSPITGNPMSDMERPRVATASLAGCFGCHMSLLDIDERIFDLIELVDFDRSPINDLKAFAGRCKIGLIEGGCANEDNVKNLREFRKHCDILIAVGDCAISGGVPAMRNNVPLRECLEEAFVGSRTAHNPEKQIPKAPELPLLLDRVYTCDEVVKVDLFIPGCPPPANALWEALCAVLNGKPIHLPFPLIKYD